MNGHQQSACGTVGEAEPSSERRYQEMLGAGLDLLDQGVTVFDAELRMVAWNTAFLRLLDFPAELARALEEIRQADAEGDERCRPLVVHHVHPHSWLLGERERHRGRP